MLTKYLVTTMNLYVIQQMKKIILYSNYLSLFLFVSRFLISTFLTPTSSLPIIGGAEFFL